MEHLSYTIEDNAIAELFGVQNFTNKESALLELIKNAYDARAKTIHITFAGDKLLVTDNGKGMSADDIYKHWMHVGKSDKEYWVEDEDSEEKRVSAGSKGVGRFALARLGSQVEINSKKSDCAPIEWKTNWNGSTLEEALCNDLQNSGTIITICELRDKWSEGAIKKLSDYLSLTYMDTTMEIILVSEKSEYRVMPYYRTPIMGTNFVCKIGLNYNSNRTVLQCNILSDEFQEGASKFYDPALLKQFESEINIADDLEGNKDFDESSEEINSLLKRLGNFSAELYFSLKSSTEKDVESFLYKHQSLSERYNKGVILYRNAFSISSFEGNRDWLGLGKRSRKSPAAATHESGSWRVRENQLSGKVIIDKKKNENLKDLSNRQGLDEDTFFSLFVKIIDIGIAEFERYRQNIIRRINVKNKIVDDDQDESLISQIIKTPKSLSELSEKQAAELAFELASLQAAKDAYKDEQKSTEEKYRYDVRILNVFATTGLKATSIAHEMKNDRNSISGNYQRIINALNEYDLWEMLNLPEYTELAYKNIPQLLEKNRRINTKVLSFMNMMLSNTEKRKFNPVDINIFSELSEIKQNWERDYSWISIDCDLDENLVFRSAGDVLTVVFDNLILNSIQQNDASQKLIVNIHVERGGDRLFFSYHDDGRGLPLKYINNPMRILEVHETSRKNGHGLGMWILKNTLDRTGGQVLKIYNDNGFNIEFELGSEL